MYRHILLAVKPQASYQALLIKAANLAELNGAKLSLIHVIDTIPNDIGEQLADHIDGQLTQQLVRDRQHRLDELAQQLCRQHPALKVSSQAVLGSRREEIVNYCRQHGCDLLVVGQRQRKGLGKLWAHTEDSLLRHANCDVLAVKL